jgi:hypothetical protein
MTRWDIQHSTQHPTNQTEQTHHPSQQLPNILHYKDDEGDYVTICTDNDMNEALDFCIRMKCNTLTLLYGKGVLLKQETENTLNSEKKGKM